MKTNRGYMLVVVLLVVAVIAIITVKMLGKPAESAPANEYEVQRVEVDKATTYQGAIQTKAKANTVVNSENAYNQDLNIELNH